MDILQAFLLMSLCGLPEAQEQALQKLGEHVVLEGEVANQKTFKLTSSQKGETWTLLLQEGKRECVILMGRNLKVSR